jgi:hypothetical protein
MDATNRDIFISEFIIHYLQSRYPNRYSDQTIVNNYKDYRKLRIIKELSDKYHDNEEIRNKMTDDDKERLIKLHQYFYGSDDGSNPSSGSNIARDYITVLNSVKHIIDENDNAIKDIVSGITSLLETSSADNPNQNIAKMYLENVVISPLIIALESSFDDVFTVSEPFKKVNDIDIKTKKAIFTDHIEDSDNIRDKKIKEKEDKEAKLTAKKQKETEAEAGIKTKNEAEGKKAKMRIFEKDVKNIYEKFKNCYDESKNVIKDSIYFDSITEYLKQNQNKPIDPEIKKIFEEIKNLNQIKKELEAKKIEEITAEDEERKKQTSQLLTENL